MSRARPKMGRSISRHTCEGSAPITSAASRKFDRMLRSAGVIVRTTNGKATSECANGINTHDERSVGKPIRKPKPNVTAEAPRGSAQIGSLRRDQRPLLAEAYAASVPMINAITVVVTANNSELPSAVKGGTNNTDPRGLVARFK